MTRQFGPGGYYVRTPDDTEDDATAEARDFFVEVVIDEIPEMLKGFRDDVVPGFDLLFERWRDQPEGPVMNVITTWFGLQSVPDPDVTLLEDDLPSDGELRELWDALTEWARAYVLSDNRWFMLRLILRAGLAFRVREGLHSPDHGPDAELAEVVWSPSFTPYTMMPLVPDEVKPLVLPGWDGLRTWGEWRNWIEREALPAALAEYKERIDQDPSLGKPRTTMYDDLHFRWLARWQIRKESYRAIHVSEHAGTEDQVRKAVRRTAMLIGLIRRTETRLRAI